MINFRYFGISLLGSVDGVMDVFSDEKLRNSIASVS